MVGSSLVAVGKGLHCMQLAIGSSLEHRVIDRGIGYLEVAFAIQACRMGTNHTMVIQTIASQKATTHKAANQMATSHIAAMHFVHTTNMATNLGAMAPSCQGYYPGYSN